MLHLLFTYCPITLRDEVRLTCRNTVNGNWMLSIICEISSPLNGSPIKQINSNAMPNDRITPTCEWLSLMWYDSPKIPAKMEPAAMPLVIVEEMPAISNASANTTPALLPSNGSNSDFACCNSST